MEAFAIGGIMFLIFAVIGLLLLVTGIIFVVKNIKWKRLKDQKGMSSTGNIVGIVLFSLMIFFGAMWLICFGVGAVTFFIVSAM